MPGLGAWADCAQPSLGKVTVTPSGYFGKASSKRMSPVRGQEGREWATETQAEEGQGRAGA